MDTAIVPYRVHECSKCPGDTGDTEYYCVSCPCHMCPQCKENHVKDLQTIYHDVVSHRDKINYIPTQNYVTDLRTIDHSVKTYRDKFKYIPTQAICQRHSNMLYEMYCEPCELPVCNHCLEHKTHRWVDIRKAYQRKRQQHRGTIHTIRSDSLFYRPVLLSESVADIKTCKTNFSLYQSEMFTKAERLKNLLYKGIGHVELKHRCLKQKIEMNRHIVTLQAYVNVYEQSAFNPIQFLSFIKTVCLLHIHPTLHTSQFSMTDSVNKEDVMESLSGIQITEIGNRRLLKLIYPPEFKHSLRLTDLDCCDHISCMKSDRVWVSDRKNNLIFINKKGDILHRVDNICSRNGVHTVNSQTELIYIDKNYNINKLSKNMKTTTPFIQKADSKWRPHCVHWSPSTGDMLVGMYRDDLMKGKVARYNQTGQLTQTIQHYDPEERLYWEPIYITENNNGDVVVSDCICILYSAVKVTDHGGKHRFSYFGQSEVGFQPRGICTDALSHILVSDFMTHTVQMLNKDGQFLLHLLIRPSGILTPCGLSYDINTHRLWVGSHINNRLSVYRYIDRQQDIMEITQDTTDVMDSLSKIPKTETEKPQDVKECLLKLISAPELLHTITLEGFVGCVHISCVTPDRVWVSDGKCNLILTNTKGDILHQLKELWDDLYYNGVHTVNSESELIYISRYFNINKLSKDLKTTTTFIERTDSTWRPQCVYWSPSTKDLLVGMHREDIKTGKVTRHNQSGELIQTIQQENTGLDMYIQPIYITENNNGDVVVSNRCSAVVVTDREGVHRFTYTGHPPGSGLQPYGICTDALSHILVCDYTTEAVHMLDKDGRFLSHLLKLEHTFGEQHSLSYDVNTHLLWVGSWYNRVVVYRYIDQRDTNEDKQTHCSNNDALTSLTPP